MARSTSESDFDIVFGGMRAMVAMVELDLLDANDLPPVALRQQHLRGAGLVDHVDRLVRQLPVVDVLGRQLDRRLDRLARVAHPMEVLEIGLEAFEDLDRIGDGRLVHVDLLEPAHQRPVLLEVLPVFLVGGRADAAERAGLQRWLEQVRSIHRSARRGAGADHGVDLIDEHDGAGIILDLAHHGLEPLLEIAAIAGAGEQRAHVELEDGGFGEHLRHVAHDDSAGQAFGNGRLADAWVADEQRVVLLPAAQHLDGALNLGGPPDQGIDPAGPRLLVQVDAIDLERIGAALLLVAAFDSRGIFLHAAHGARLGHAGALGDAVTDVVHRIEAGHVLLLQEEGGVALALGENRHEHIGAGHLLAARGLHMGDGAMDDALEAGGRLGVVMRIEHEARKLVIEISGELVPQQVDIDVAGAHHRRCVAIVEQRQEQML